MTAAATVAAFPEGGWRVPVEMVLRCTSSSLKGLVEMRERSGDRPSAVAQVFARGDRLFAVIDFQGAGRPGLLLPLDVWLWENRA